jgi:hypothetical protein
MAFGAFIDASSRWWKSAVPGRLNGRRDGGIHAAEAQNEIAFLHESDFFS